ncbi:MAG TPA: hypothetical protein VK581_04895, partial [Chthoniobacterales bacterium]|nr:hypothetical protein [Chthoniobacterales bacterium]
MFSSPPPLLALAGTKWVPVIALLFALVAGAFALQQRQGARDLTKRIASLAAEMREKNDAIQDRAALIIRLQAENDTYIKESALLRERGTTPVPEAQDAGPERSLSSEDKNKVELVAKTFDDPRGREVIRQKQ